MGLERKEKKIIKSVGGGGMISRGGGGRYGAGVGVGVGEEMRLSGLYGCYLFVFARYFLEDKVTVCRFSHQPRLHPLAVVSLFFRPELRRRSRSLWGRGRGKRFVVRLHTYLTKLVCGRPQASGE